MSPCFYDAKVLLNGINQACKTNITVGASGVDLEYPENYLDSTEWYVDFNKPVDFTQYTIEKLCAVNVQYLRAEHQYLYYEQIANNIVENYDTDEYEDLKNSFYDEDYAKYLKQDTGKLSDILSVIKYELFMNSKDLNKINTFMKPLETQDEIGIKVLVYSADEPYRSLFIEYLDEFKITDTKAADYAVGFYYNKNVIEINVVADRTNPCGAYYTFFHEVGHAIDYYYGIDKGYETFSTIFFVGAKGYTLLEANHLDVQEAVSVAIENLYENIQPLCLWDSYEKENTKEFIMQNVMNDHVKTEELVGTASILQKELSNFFYVNLYGDFNTSASDVFGGITDNIIRSEYGHAYWSDIDGTGTVYTNTEAFAQYYGKCLIGEPERTYGMTNISYWMPETMLVIEEQISEMGKTINE